VTIKSAQFLSSNTELAKMPPAIYPEFAFIGRSNVGKSSLINMLCDRRSLAKTSQTPGKTQLVNHFLINSSWYLTDLPGYGYARVSQASRAKWSKNTLNYLLKRPNLVAVFQLLDSRLPPQKIDLEFTDWLGENQIPFFLVLTKADKQGRQKSLFHASQYREQMALTWERVPKMILTSAQTHEGKPELLDLIAELIAQVNTLEIPEP